MLVILGWLIAMALASWSLGSPWQLARRDYVYDVVEATNYIVISPVVSALALSWIVFACYTNHGGLSFFYPTSIMKIYRVALHVLHPIEIYHFLRIHNL